MPAQSAGAKAVGSATFTIRIPKSTPANAHAQYISPNTASLRIHLAPVNGSAPVPSVADVIMNVTPASAECTSSSGYTVCTETTAAVIGNDVYNLMLYAHTGGTGLVVGTSSPSVTVVQGVAANVPVTLETGPTVFNMSQYTISGGNDGSVHTMTFQVWAKDASGATIVAPGNYSSPIALAISGDTNGALSITPSSITAPPANGKTTVTVTYDSSKAFSSGAVVITGGTAPTGYVQIQTIVPSRTSMRNMFASASSQSMTVSESGYASAFTVSGVSGVASTSCVPATCTPTTSGGPVTITFTPTTAGSATASIADAIGGAVSIPVGVGGSAPTNPIPASAFNSLWFLASNPSGDIYLNSGSSIYYWNPSSCATSCTPSSFALSYTSNNAMVYGGDGNLYASGIGTSGGLDKISSCPSTCTQTKIGTIATTGGYGVAYGGDGNIWVTYGGNATVYRITPSGTTTTYTFTGYKPWDIVEAPDGTLWFADSGDKSIGHFDPSACTATSCTITSYAITQSSSPGRIGITAGGTVWVGEGAAYIAEISCASSCALTEYSLPSSVSNTTFVVALPDGLIATTDTTNKKINIIDPLTCSAGSCPLAFQSAANYNGSPVYGSDGALWGIGTGALGIYRLTLP